MIILTDNLTIYIVYLVHHSGHIVQYFDVHISTHCRRFDNYAKINHRLFLT